MFNRIFQTTLLFVLALTVACSAAATPTPSGTFASALTDTYTDALTIKNQLAVGTLKLAGTPNEMTKDQAAKLVPLWQTSKALTVSGSASTAETNAVLAQIEQVLTPAQVNAIKEMALTNATLQALYVEWGLSTAEPGTTPTGTGMSKTLSQAEREATRAAGGTTTTGTGTTGKGTVVIDKVIEYLTARAAGK